MKRNFELLRNVNTLKWYTVYTDDKGIIVGGKELGKKKLLIETDFEHLLNNFFYYDHNGKWFSSYAWITKNLELVFLPTEKYDIHLLTKTMTKEILITLDTRESIEIYYNTYIKV